MCIICAAIPATAALGAKFNADQLHKSAEQQKSVFKITSFTIALLVIASSIYHTLRWQN